MSLVLFIVGLNNNFLNYYLIQNENSVIKISALFYIIIFIYLIYFSVTQYVQKIHIFREFKYIFFLLLLCLPITLTGPFLQPPSDPIFHATVLTDSKIDDIYRNTLNHAFLNKGLYKIILSFLVNEESFYSKLFSLFAFHSITGMMLSSAVYVSSRLSGLPVKWSYLSVFLMFGLFGTDRFNFYAYYSLAPTSLNMPLFWLIMGLMLRLTLYKVKFDLYVLLKLMWVFFIGLSITTIIFYSHRQEGAFFLYLYMFILFVFLSKILYHFSKIRYLYYLILLSIFFLPFALLKKLSILPETVFQNVVRYANYIVNIADIWYIGYWNAPRFFNTLSFYGFAPLLFLFLLLYSSNKRRTLMGILPGIFPFWIMFIPLNFFIWIYAVQSEGALYRLNYTSQYWISIAYFFFMNEYKAVRFLRKIKIFKK